MDKDWTETTRRSNHGFVEFLNHVIGKVNHVMVKVCYLQGQSHKVILAITMLRPRDTRPSHYIYVPGLEPRAEERTPYMNFLHLFEMCHLYLIRDILLFID